ncbi:MAG: ABC transporter ATP-binding protein [Granulosicoccus sp.]
MAEIRVEQLHKTFGDFIAVENSSFVVDDGDFFVMLGASGCGKTTTLRMIAGLELPTSGHIYLGGEDVTYQRARERDIAFVFQLFALYPHMNVRNNMAFPLKAMGMPRKQIRERVEETSRLLRIDHLLNQSVSGLAGGDRQRVALGRAIVRRPDCFLMDEPLGTLDTEFRDLMVNELRDLHDRIDATTVYVTHDQLEAMSMADKIAIMHNGVIEQFGTPAEIYHHPVSMYVADFIGSPPMNFLNVEAALAAGDTALRVGESNIAVPALRESLSVGARAIGVRPEHILLNDESGLRGRVYGTEYLGTNQIVTVESEHGMLKARVASNRKIDVGDAIGMNFVTDQLSLFDVDSGRALATARDDGAGVHSAVSRESHHG